MTLPEEPQPWQGTRSGLERREGAGGAPGLPAWGETARLVHELRVHQLELGMQNEALKEARLEAELGWDHYRELYDFAPVGYFTLDTSGLILQVNFAGARLLGWDRARLINCRFSQFLSSADWTAFAAFLAKGFGKEEAQACEVTLAPDGFVGARVRLESTSSGAGDRLRLVAVDLTELHAAKEQVSILNAELERRVALRTAELEVANDDLQAFCYMISHELRAPLARMEGFSRMLLKLDLDQHLARLPHVAERIEASSQRMREVVDSLLKMTRLALDKLDLEEVDLSQMARETLERLGKDGLRLPARVMVADGVTVRGDRRLLEICLRNLLENALKFSSKTPEAEVEFGVSTLRGQRVLSVRDNGTGFDMTHAHKLFLAFVRLHRQEDFPGSGLGLNIVRKIVEKHGGRIWCSSSPGAGATFYFTLDRA